ncbi:MAG TPA: hypothetical protein VGN15_11080 [Ktedonobacteraceae bacterium]|jgi:hypothetical protein|nr:hypothetical protein [Ktedonobacteraceae bacterium]
MAYETLPMPLRHCTGQFLLIHQLGLLLLAKLLHQLAPLLASIANY